MKEIHLNDIRISNSSYADPNGFVFQYNHKLYRAVNSGRESFYRGLFEKGVIERLCGRSCLVPSEITDYAIPEIGCNLVIGHERIEPETYCVEWCPSMLKKAALATLELGAELLKYNCRLQDASAWNIMFKFTKPRFVDLTSIVPIEDRMIWPAYQQFINFFLNPLKLCSMGKGRVARMLLYDYTNGVTINELNSNYGPMYGLSHPAEIIFSFACEKMAARIQSNPPLKRKFQNAVKSEKINRHSEALRPRFFERLLRKVNKIKVKAERSGWEDYYGKEGKDFDPGKKSGIADRLIRELKPRSVLDIGSNTGRYSIMAAGKGARVMAMDSSEGCLERSFAVFDKDGYTITPVVADILSPTPSFGFLSNQFPPLTERAGSDLVLFLGLMHHLHINGRQPFGRIASLLDKLSKRAVIFEYVDPADESIHMLDHGRPIAYSIQTVSEALSRYFKLDFFESDRRSRRIILCTK